MTDPVDAILVFTTCPDAATSNRVAQALVGQQLAACVNIVPGLTSVYRWQGKVETAAEQLLVIKTRRAAYGAVEAAIRNAHPYELPEVLAIPIGTGLPAYLAWVVDNVRV